MKISPQTDQISAACGNLENVEAGLEEDHKSPVMSQVALEMSVKGVTSSFDGKNMAMKLNSVVNFCQDKISSKASSTEKLGPVLSAREERYSNKLEGGKKCKRKRKKKKNLSAERQLEPKDLSTSQNIESAASLDNKGNFERGLQREDKGAVISLVASESFVREAPISFDGKLKEENCNDLSSSWPSSTEKPGPVLLPCEGGYFTLLETKQKRKRKRKRKKDWNADTQLGSELMKKEHTKPLEVRKCEKNPLKWKKVAEHTDANGEAFDKIILPSTHSAEDCLKTCTEVKSKKHRRRHSAEMTGPGKKVCNGAASTLYKNSEKLTVTDDFEAGTFGDFSKQGQSSAQIEALYKGVDGDVRHHASGLKVQYPLSNFKDLYIILDLNGLLIKRWDVNPSLPDISKLRRRWVKLRPGCIEFLCKAFSIFKVGIWSTMTERNVLDVCKFLEQRARQRLPFFMSWSKDSCYQLEGVCRPDKPFVLADFKPLSYVWQIFGPYLGPHNTVLVDDSPYKACMNDPYNCIFPDAYDGCSDDNFLVDVLWPYLEKMRMAQKLQAYIANNPFGQKPVVVGHELYGHVWQVIYAFAKHQ